MEHFPARCREIRFGEKTSQQLRVIMDVSSMTSFRTPALGTFFRLLLAVFGGLATAHLFGAMLAVWLPFPKADATILACLLAYLLLIAAGVWAFAASSLWRAILGMGAFSLGSALLLYIKTGGGLA